MKSFSTSVIPADRRPLEGEYHVFQYGVHHDRRGVCFHRWLRWNWSVRIHATAKAWVVLEVRHYDHLYQTHEVDRVKVSKRHRAELHAIGRAAVETAFPDAFLDYLAEHGNAEERRVAELATSLLLTTPA